MSDAIHVRVPATSANLGPGFDALGLALEIYNTTSVRRSDGPIDHPMAREAADAYFAATGLDPFSFAWEIAGEVPRSRGLGSSVTVRLGILHGINALAGSPLDADSIYRLCARLEGHPDNAAPAAFGGFTVARADGAYQRFAVDARLGFVVLIPDFEVETKAARKVLPETIPFFDGVLSAANAASVAAAFASGHYEALSGCFRDGLHQPYRAALIPGIKDVFDAAESAGALGAWISGSGSTLAACTLGDVSPLASAMSGAFGDREHRMMTVRADNVGVQIGVSPEV